MDLLFPNIVTYHKDKDFNTYKQEFIKYCYFLKKETKGVKKSNSLGWHSEDQVHLRNDFNFLDKISSIIETTIKDLHLKDCSISLNSLWININQKWAYNHRHIHPNSHLSGIFYLKVPENSGDLIFVNDNMQMNNVYEFMNENATKSIKLYPTYRYKPEEGRMFIFDSLLPHYVEQNTSREDRISISFNLNLS